MRVTILTYIAIFAIYALSPSVAQDHAPAKLAMAPEVAATTLQHLNGPIYFVEDLNYIATNYVIYVGETSVTVIGATWTPGTSEKLAEKIKRVTSKPITEVIDTSPDPEWSGGNAYWAKAGAKVFAVQKTYDLLKDNWNPTITFVQQHQSEFSSQQLSLPTNIVPDHFELQHGDLQILYLGPSHTPGDVFVYFPREKILDAGSIVKEQLGNVANATLPEYRETLRKLSGLHLDIRTVISGHWSAIHGPDLIGHYMDLLKEHDAVNPQTSGK